MKSEKLDLTKQFKSYFKAGSKPELVEIGEVMYLSIQGKGDPSGEAFAERLQALYSVAYTLKFMSKARDRDFAVSKLEGLWSFDEERYKDLSMNEAPLKVPRSEWRYRLMIMMPAYIEQEQVDKAVRQVLDKKGIRLAGEVELFRMTEGLAVQLLHTGPFSKEPESLALIAAFTQKHNLARNGLHHEIYLSDFRRTAPERLRTILREPVRQAGAS